MWNIDKWLADVSLNFLQIEVLKDFFTGERLFPEHVLLGCKFRIPFELTAFQIEGHLFI